MNTLLWNLCDNTYGKTIQDTEGISLCSGYIGDMVEYASIGTSVMFKLKNHYIDTIYNCSIEVDYTYKTSSLRPLQNISKSIESYYYDLVNNRKVLQSK